MATVDDRAVTVAGGQMREALSRLSDVFDRAEEAAADLLATLKENDDDDR